MSLQTRGDKPVVIDFWAPWCGPCRMISPIFEKFSQLPGYSDNVGFYKVDIDDQEEIASHVGIRAVCVLYGYCVGVQSS